MFPGECFNVRFIGTRHTCDMFRDRAEHFVKTPLYEAIPVAVDLLQDYGIKNLGKQRSRRNGLLLRKNFWYWLIFDRDLPANFTTPDKHIPSTREKRISMSSTDMRRSSPNVRLSRRGRTYRFCSLVSKYVRNVFENISTILLP